MCRKLISLMMIAMMFVMWVPTGAEANTVGTSYCDISSPPPDVKAGDELVLVASASVTGTMSFRGFGVPESSDSNVVMIVSYTQDGETLSIKCKALAPGTVKISVPFDFFEKSLGSRPVVDTESITVVPDEESVWSVLWSIPEFRQFVMKQLAVPFPGSGMLLPDFTVENAKTLANIALILAGEIVAIPLLLSFGIAAFFETE